MLYSKYNNIQLVELLDSWGPVCNGGTDATNGAVLLFVVVSCAKASLKHLLYYNYVCFVHV